MLSDFVKMNGGRLEIFSNDGYVLIDQNQETYLDRPTGFGGTIVNITLECDESYYQLTSEPDNEPLF